MKNFAFIFCIFLFLSCNSNDDDNHCEKFIQVDEKTFQETPSDTFELVDIELNEHCLKASIRYGGGCGESSLQLIGSENIFDSAPKQRNIKLLLTDNDPCEAFITKDFYFDLTPTQIAESNEMRLNLLNWSEPILYNY